jgi:hypothetical protein
MILMALVGLMTACASSSPEAAYAPMPPAESDGAFDAGMAEAPAAVEAAPGSEYEGRIAPVEEILYQAAQPQDTRVIIYTGNISLVVNDTREAMTGCRPRAIWILWKNCGP